MSPTPPVLFFFLASWRSGTPHALFFYAELLWLTFLRHRIPVPLRTLCFTILFVSPFGTGASDGVRPVIWPLFYGKKLDCCTRMLSSLPVWARRQLCLSAGGTASCQSCLPATKGKCMAASPGWHSDLQLASFLIPAEQLHDIIKRW